MKERCILLLLLFNIILSVPGKVIRQEKVKYTQIEKEVINVSMFRQYDHLHKNPKESTG